MADLRETDHSPEVPSARGAHALCTHFLCPACEIFCAVIGVVKKYCYKVVRNEPRSTRATGTDLYTGADARSPLFVGHIRSTSL